MNIFLKIYLVEFCDIDTDVSHVILGQTFFAKVEPIQNLIANISLQNFCWIGNINTIFIRIKTLQGI